MNKKDKELLEIQESSRIDVIIALKNQGVPRDILERVYSKEIVAKAFNKEY